MPPRLPPSAASIGFPTPSARTHCKSCLYRAFSTTPVLPQTKLREQFFIWLRGPGQNFQHPLPGSTNYLSAYDNRGDLVRLKDGSRKAPPKKRSVEEAMTEDEEALEAAAEADEQLQLPKERREDLRPFPNNHHFYSESILSEDLQKEIWARVQQQGKSVRQVSIEMGVDMRRVAAVVRLVEVEKKMLAEGKSLAVPYARAVHSMVPVTMMNPNNRNPKEPHESINDLEQHPITYPQIFYPTSESRAFNRTDAGRVFSGAPRLPDDQDIGQGGKPAQEPWQDTKPEIIGRPGHTHPVLKPADSRIPHPHLIAFQRDKSDDSLSLAERNARHRKRLQEDEDRRQAAKQKYQEEEERKKTRVDGDRWQFVVTEVLATRQGTGLNGRGTGAPGMRYGVPSQDRKKGHVKIPTRVEV